MLVPFVSSRLLVPFAFASLFVAVGCSSAPAGEAQRQRTSEQRIPGDAGDSIAPEDTRAAVDVCESLCTRQVACDPSTDEDTCVAQCRNDAGRVFSKLRHDYSADLASCLETSACREFESGSAASDCADEARARLVVTKPTTDFCDAYGAAASKCGETLNKADCISQSKVYSDATFADMTQCLGKKCADIGACIDAATGSTTASPSPAPAVCSAKLPYDNGGSCGICMNAACCAEDNACANDASCGSWIACATTCTTTACFSACDSAYPAGRARFDSVAACMNSSCSSSCGD